MTSGFNMFRNNIDITPPISDAWADICVAGLVPANATGVVVRLPGGYSALRCKGSIDDFVQYCGAPDHSYAYCGLDETLTFQAYYTYHPYVEHKVFLCGYTDEAVTFFRNAIDLDVPLAEYVWEEVDISSYVPPEATGAIFFVFNTHETMGHHFGIRCKGSTDIQSIRAGHATHLQAGEANNFVYPVIGLEDQKFEFYRKGFVSPIGVFLVGYTKPPVTFFKNAKPVAIGSIVGLQPYISLSANGVIAELRNDTDVSGHPSVGVREPGSSNPPIKLGVAFAAWQACGVSKNQEIETLGFETEGLRLFIQGYTEPAELPVEFPCPYCPAVLPSQEELDTHIAQEHTGILSITSTPSGASILINDEFIEVTPYSVDLLSGAYNLLLKLEGYEDYIATVEVIAKETVTIHADLTPLPPVKGILSVISSPIGASIYLNDVFTGITPFDLELDPAVYNVRLELTGYQSYITIAEVLAGEIASIDVALTPLPPEKGTLIVTSDPSGADVLISGLLVGTTPFEQLLDPGLHEILVTLAGYESYSATVEVLAAQTTTIHAVLAPIPPEKGSLVITSSPPGADIYLEGVFAGTTTLELLLDPNIYHVLLTLLGYEDYTTTVEVIEGETTTAHATLTPVKPEKVPTWVPIAVGSGIVGLIALIVKGRKG